MAMLTRACIVPTGPPRRRPPDALECTGNRRPSPRREAANLAAAGVALAVCAVAAAGTSYPLEVLSPEAKRMTDPRTGAELLFLTTAPENDANLYFHEYSWLAD